MKTVKAVCYDLLRMKGGSFELRFLPEMEVFEITMSTMHPDGSGRHIVNREKFTLQLLEQCKIDAPEMIIEKMMRDFEDHNVF